MGKYRRSDVETGDAGHDGFTCLGRRPKHAAPGNVAPLSELEHLDELGEFQAKYGGRDSLRRDIEDDDYPYGY